MRRLFSAAVTSAGLLLVGAAPAVACPDHAIEPAESSLLEVLTQLTVAVSAVG